MHAHLAHTILRVLLSSAYVFNSPAHAPSQSALAGGGRAALHRDEPHWRTPTNKKRKITTPLRPNTQPLCCFAPLPHAIQKVPILPFWYVRRGVRRQNMFPASARGAAIMPQRPACRRQRRIVKRARCARAQGSATSISSARASWLMPPMPACHRGAGACACSRQRGCCFSRGRPLARCSVFDAMAHRSLVSHHFSS